LDQLISYSKLKNEVFDMEIGPQICCGLDMKVINQTNT
jgi:hypothetical protein